jgi:hypothetical protein
MRRLLSILMTLLALSGMVLLGLGAAYLQRSPLVPAMTAPGPADVAAARALAQRVHSAIDHPSSGARSVSVTPADLNAALRMGARVLPGFRATSELAGAELVTSVSIPVHWLSGTRWLNLRLGLGSFEGPPALSSVQIGGRAVPPPTVLAFTRIGLNLYLGGQTGDRLFAAAQGLAIDGNQLILALNADAEGRVMAGVLGALRDDSMPSAPQIDRYAGLISEALKEGALPRRGSLMPHLLFILTAAYDRSTDATATGEFAAAILGLNSVCGAQEFAAVVDELAKVNSPTGRRARADCSAITLAGRKDLRLHFVTSAAIKAAGNRGLALSMGEFKELFDQREGGSKFDFTDIAADNSGVRLADLFMTTPRGDWPRLIARVTTEEAVLADLSGLPAPMGDAQFRQRFGDVNSDSFRDMIAEIEARIDRTALHATSPKGGQ